MSSIPHASPRLRNPSSHIFRASDQRRNLQNYLASLPNLVDNDSGTAKVDWDLSSKNRILWNLQPRKICEPRHRQPGGGHRHHELDVAHPLHRWQRRDRVGDPGANSRRLRHSSEHRERLRLWIEPPLHTADEQHRRRQLSIQGRAHRPAAWNRGYRLP